MSDDNVKAIARALLSEASGVFSNHGCNDFDLAAIVPDVAARRAIMLRVAQWNERTETPRDYDPEDTFDVVPDWLLMRWLARGGLQ